MVAGPYTWAEDRVKLELLLIPAETRSPMHTQRGPELERISIRPDERRDFVRRASLALAPLALWSLMACGSSPAPDPCEDAPSFTRDLRPGVVREKCLMCHSEALTGVERRGAPDDLNFDRYALVAPREVDFASALTSGRMPPPDVLPLVETTPEERALGAKWRQCGYRE